MGWGWWVEKLTIRLNSAQLKLKLPVGAELGKILILLQTFVFCPMQNFFLSFGYLDKFCMNNKNPSEIKFVY